MFRLVDRPVMPLSTPIWGRNPATSRETGDQTAVSSLPLILRTICSPHWCGVSSARWG